MFDWTQNPFVAGTVAVVVTGAAMGMLYKLPPMIWRFLRNRFILTVDIDNIDASYRWLKAYLGHVATARWLVAGSLPSPDSTDHYSPRQARTFYLSPRGLCWFKFKGHRFLAWTEKEALQNTIDYRETITLQCWRRPGRSGVELIKNLLEEARQFAMNQGGRRVEVWMPSGSEWAVSDRKMPRKRESLVFNNGTMAEIVDDAKEFLAAREWYSEMGLPWRRSYLLHGPPGNGKSSLVHVLASELGSHVNVANLSHFENDAQMVTCLSRVPAGNILLLEDIDAAFNGRTAKTGIKITFAALLNAMDGITAQDGRIVVMTTNHLEQLDAALIRPGRADIRILLDNATEQMASAMYRRFRPESELSAASSFASKHAGQSMAKIQEAILSHREEA